MRQIENDMARFIDAKLASNGLAQDAIKARNARLVFRCAVESCVGIREQGGNNNGPMVRLIQETIGRASYEAWCMALMQTGLAYAELRTGVKSPIVPTEHCLTCWLETPKDQRVGRMPSPGAIAIWQHGTSTNGHTGMVTEADFEIGFHTVEGNTNLEGSREGDGVYFKNRHWWKNGDLVLKGWLKPF